MNETLPSILDSATGLPIGPVLESGVTGPAPRPSPATIKGRYATIRRPDAARDAEGLHAGSHGPEAAALWLYMSVGPFTDRQGFTAWLARVAEGADPYFYVVADPSTDEALGLASLMRIDTAHRVIEVGNILYTPRLQRSPAATEAMYLLARHVFELGYRRYEWKCNALNAPSRRAALRLGFSYEGLFRRHMIIKGRNRDTAWFSMIAEEWPRNRAGFEAWLDPANFDAEGRQKSSLADLRAAAP
ncbi:MAG: GNAT family N-acetyltransferase [Alphaproteobacteria bacterium]|nr:GNAT family N-acetyltransferase [Alphaproteobacteria bacterium]